MIKVGAVTVNVAVVDPEPRVAVMVAVTLDVRAAVEMVNEPLVWPADIVTDAGTVTPLATLSLDRAMASPPTGAAEEILIVPVDCVPPNTAAGETVSPVSVGDDTLRCAVALLVAKVAVIVADTLAATAVVDAVKPAAV